MAGRHRKFEHPDVKGETDPRKIKEQLDRIQEENDKIMDKLRGWR